MWGCSAATAPRAGRALIAQVAERLTGVRGGPHPQESLARGVVRRACHDPERLVGLSVVQQSIKQIGIEDFVGHNLRLTCAKLGREGGGDIETNQVPAWALLIQDRMGDHRFKDYPADGA